MIINKSKLFPRRKVPTKNTLTGFIMDLIYFGMESFGKYYSTYLAKVYDNDDPERMGRVKLIIPEIAGDQPIDIWAFPKGVYSGVGYGMQMLPPNGDIVWVEFERGNVEKPIYSLGYLGVDEAPPADKYKPTENLWIRTPKGTSILIDEKENRVEIYLSGDKSGIEIKEKVISFINPDMISLGKKDKSDYSAVKGEDLLDGLRELQEGIRLISNPLQQDLTASLASTLPYLLYTNMATSVPQAIIKLNSAQNKLEKILSNNTTLQ